MDVVRRGASGDRPAVRLLVFNCHEAWVHQLGALGCELDIIVGLKGHHVAGWDLRMRPLPPRARTLSLAQVLTEPARRVPAYDCIVAHNLTDLLDVKSLPGPRLLVVHSTYEGRLRSEQSELPPDMLRQAIRRYLDQVGGHAVAVSRLKTGPGSFPADVVAAGVAVAAYPACTAELAAGLRVVNQITQKREVLLWDFHEAAFAGLPVALIGHNPDRPGIAPARDWDDLKATLAGHRFYIHTADPRYEDGYNMAMLEAMAAGLPVLGNRHPTSPIEHGVSGFLADDPAAMRRHAESLLADRELALRLGAAARATVARRFPLDRFARDFRRAIHKAQRKWRRSQPPGPRPRRAA